MSGSVTRGSQTVMYRDRAYDRTGKKPGAHDATFVRRKRVERRERQAAAQAARQEQARRQQRFAAERRIYRLTKVFGKYLPRRERTQLLLQQESV